MNANDRKHNPLTATEVARSLLERRQPAAAQPAFSAAQVKGVGGATVFEWKVDVPVCEHFPTPDAAFLATLRYAEGFRAALSEPDTLEDALTATVERGKRDGPSKR